LVKENTKKRRRVEDQEKMVLRIAETKISPLATGVDTQEKTRQMRKAEKELVGGGEAGRGVLCCKGPNFLEKDCYLRPTIRKNGPPAGKKKPNQKPDKGHEKHGIRGLGSGETG